MFVKPKDKMWSVRPYKTALVVCQRKTKIIREIKAREIKVHI